MIHHHSVPRFLLAFLLFLVSTPSAFAERDPIRLTHGPMLGRPTANSMLVWARTSDPGEFSVRYGIEENNLNQQSKPGTTVLERDNTGTVKLESLKPDTRYFYQIEWPSP